MQPERKAQTIKASEPPCNRKLSPVFRKGNLLMAVVTLICLTALACDELRTWGYHSRRNREEKIRAEDLENLQRDLEISQARALELHETIQAIAQESNHQGRISWRIAQTYVEQARYDMAAPYFVDAFEDRYNGRHDEGFVELEKALPHYERALQRNSVDPDLMYEAGLCFGNASHAMGWEEQRWRIAAMLFRRLMDIEPESNRGQYELALLLGKVENPRLRDLDRSIELLQEVVQNEEDNIPARFALAHMMVLNENLNGALIEYEAIQDRLRQLAGRGVISGSYENQPAYQNAQNNIEKLQICIQKLPGCEVMVDE